MASPSTAPALVEVTGATGWEAWLAAHHAQARSIRLVLARAGSGSDAPSIDEAIDGALIWGWIDSRSGTLDAARWWVLMSPRRPGSPWSAINKARVARLEAAGRLAAPGIAAIARARADGSWSLLDDAEAEVAPPELAALLDADPAAHATWAAWPPRVRKNALQQVALAKRPATRAARIAAIGAAAAGGRRPFGL